MPRVVLHTSPATTPSNATNPLPSLLRTPSGLALLEIQGTIHAPFPHLISPDSPSTTARTDIGRLEFPLHSPDDGDGEGMWMKKVYLYVGKHQRLVGEVKRLGKAIAVVGKREGPGGDEGAGEDELEIREIVKWKIVFGGRPEPVGGE